MSYLDLFYCAYWCPMTTWVTWRISNKRQGLFTLHEYLGYPSDGAHFTPLSFCLIFCFVFVLLLSLSSSCVLCVQCCRCLWIFHSWLARRVSLTFISGRVCSCTSGIRRATLVKNPKVSHERMKDGSHSDNRNTYVVICDIYIPLRFTKSLWRT